MNKLDAVILFAIDSDQPELRLAHDHGTMTSSRLSVSTFR
jgi:hypothetical protein